MDVKIVYEDRDLLVVEKPGEMVVNDSESARGKITLQQWVRENKMLNRQINPPDGRLAENEFYKRTGIVHRLDKETSGLLVIAKNPAAFEDLQRQFKERKVEKKYLALVHGKVEPEKGMINLPIGRQRRNRKKFGIEVDGRRAVTRYRVLKNWEMGKEKGDEKKKKGRREWVSLLELRPETGRTHQIRVHLAHLEHAVVGDSLYAGRKRARRDKKWCPRQFLHAYYLKFKHPKTAKWREFECKLPEDLEKTMKIMTI